jgi:hypothetical protein
MCSLGAQPMVLLQRSLFHLNILRANKSYRGWKGRTKEDVKGQGVFAAGIA